MRIIFIVLAILFAGVGHAAAAEAILDVAQVPGLRAEGRTAYARFLLVNTPRAFATDGRGPFGWVGGAATLEDARARAMKSCADNGGTQCAVYAEDLDVVWAGRQPVARPPGPGLVFGSWDYGLTTDDRYFRYGPQAARGVFVWGHGKGSGYDGRPVQAQAYVRAFNNAGFDVVRFVRAPFPDYADSAADMLRKGLADLRAKGWRTIVVGGQSRGAWNSLQMLSTPGLADAVIAVSAASFSSTTGQDAEMERLLRAAQSPNTRVFVAQFRDDSYMPDVAGRIAMFRSLLPPRVGALLSVADPPGITGHGGGNSSSFSIQFGPCMLRFVTETPPPSGC